jgi:hypothetical protein
MNRALGIIWRILRPHTLWIAFLTILSLAAIIFVFSTNRDMTVIGYISYVLSAYTLTVLIINMPVMVSSAKSLIDKSKPGNFVKTLVYSNKYSSQYMTSKPYRARIALYVSLIMNFIYAAQKLIAGVYYASFWYGADAIFYIVLSAVQFLMLRHVRKKENSLENEYRQYRFCGYLIFAMNVAFIGVAFQIIHQNMGYQYPGLLIYVAATYAFICLAVAISNVFVYRKLNSPVLSAIKAISLVKALVAIYALQTAMLTTFGGEDAGNFQRIMNSLTGGGICFFIFVIAVFMVIKAHKGLKDVRINNLET